MVQQSEQFLDRVDLDKTHQGKKSSDGLIIMGAKL